MKTQSEQAFTRKVLMAIEIVNRALAERDFADEHIWASMNNMLANWQGQR